MRNKILIADANEVNREILEELFEESFTVVSVATGQEALDIILKEYSDIAVAILDMGLEDKNAVDILAEINTASWFEDLPVYVLSDDTSLKIEKSAYKAGAIDFSRKPFDSRLLERKVKKYAELFAVQETLHETQAALNNALKNAGSAQAVASASPTLVMEEDVYYSRHNKLIELVGTLTELRNVENQQHVQRMKGLVKIMAKKMQEMYPEYNLTIEKINYIVTACSIHDLGKAAIKDAVLLKPGRFTDEEYEYMKSHTLRGIDLLDQVQGAWSPEFDVIAREVVRSHHEKFDGGGYPDGLKGDEIPISAQLVSIADTYDALVNDRVYKKAYPKDVAFNKIIVGDCGIFPPKILECFKACRDDWEAWENKEITFEQI